jgi:hypothetical protein
MTGSAEVLKNFYAAVIKQDLAKARTYLADEMVFVGLFETYPNADAYIKALTGLLQITRELQIKTIIGEGAEAAVFFDLVTGHPAAATTLVAEWHQVRNGKIYHVESAFDGRAFEAMFTTK